MDSIPYIVLAKDECRERSEVRVHEAHKAKRVR